ncbi:MAG: dockerin type I domain-containing protein [Planctomycetota bacterium]|jgi:hypothetical protein
MKKLIFLALFLGMTPAAFGEVTARTHLFLPDGNAPPEPQEIMVGTQLSIIVASDVNEIWSGGLALSDANSNYAVLFGRDFNENSWPEPYSYEGSRLPAAGVVASVFDWEEPGFDGFDLYTGLYNIEKGDWFVIDYNATDIGNCNVGFYEHIPFEDPNLIDYLEFIHVRTRDFNNDTQVDFRDFAVFASYWRDTGYSDPNQCEGTDLDADGNVDVNDLKLFADYWCENTDKRWWP